MGAVSGMHLHVGSNIPGCLPQTTPACLTDLDGAMDFLRAELRAAQDDFFERCTECDPDAMGDPCAWCDVAGDVEAVLGAIAEGDAAYRLRRSPEIGWTFRPPEGADIHYWCVRLTTKASACELADALTL
jgi:hypothetical protein